MSCLSELLCLFYSDSTEEPAPPCKMTLPQPTNLKFPDLAAVRSGDPSGTRQPELNAVKLSNGWNSKPAGKANPSGVEGKPAGLK